MTMNRPRRRPGAALFALAALAAACSAPAARAPAAPSPGGAPPPSTAKPPAPAASVAAPFEAADPASVGIDPSALEALKRRGEATHSDAVVVVKDGKLIAHWSFGTPDGPIEAMSATKSIVGLAALKLVEQGKVRSLDEPVHSFYPEWKQGKKAKITLRHLLQQTSGLQHEPNTTVIYESPDFVQLALAAELEGEPGGTWGYNNKAVNLIAGVVKKAAGVPLDEYVKRELFTPLGITDFGWDHDKAGNPHAMSGLQIRPLDLARFGQMMLDGGAFKGKRVLGEAWARRAYEDVMPDFPDYGLLWWVLADKKRVIDDALVASWKRAGVDAALARKASSLKGRVYASGTAFYADALKAFGGEEGWQAWRAELDRHGVKPTTVVERKPYGLWAQGYLGQYLVVIPSARLVGVRMRRPEHGAENDRDAGFDDFTDMLRALAPAAPR